MSSHYLINERNFVKNLIYYEFKTTKKLLKTLNIFKKKL